MQAVYSDVSIDEVTGEAERCPYCDWQFHRDDSGLWYCGCEEED